MGDVLKGIVTMGDNVLKDIKLLWETMSSKVLSYYYLRQNVLSHRATMGNNLIKGTELLWRTSSSKV